MMKLREVDNMNDGPSLGRVVEVSNEHGQAILDLQERRGYTAWEKAPKNATVNAELFPADEPIADETAETVTTDEAKDE